ncbi:MAG: Xaa-Pro aminopeptidase [Burkholderiaceae bacterium]|nr:MAG: Xaa-Pro aminopeptidase [Burkholderiaceae bacterium]
MNTALNTVYHQRRQHLLAQMHAQGGGVALLPTAPEVMRNRDSDYPYRHDSHFYYLTGFSEPEAWLVLVAGEKDQAILFCREKNLEREIWDGFRHGPAHAQEKFGFDAAYAIEQLGSEMPRLLANQPAVFYALNSSRDLDHKLQRWLDAVRAQSRSGVTAPHAAFDLLHLIDEMRLFKDAHEIDIMRRAAQISAQAHVRAMQTAAPGKMEYEIEAELLHEFRRHGSQFPAYGSIVAGGANACVLHYRGNDAKLKDGDLLLIDAGCELDSYASDITRTFPVNGKFSAAQRTLYDIVLAAQAAAIAATQPSNRFIDPHNAAVNVLAQGLLDTGLLKGSLDEVLESGSYKQFYMHRTSHWIGMDVHDVGAYRELNARSEETASRILQPGMAMTIEPGLYIRPADGVPEHFWNIGIRIEDDALLTPTGCEILTSGVPNKADEIEALMRH